MSSLGLPRRKITSSWETMPTNRPASSTTGAPLMFSRLSVSHRPSMVVCGRQVMGSRVMISLAFMGPPESTAPWRRYISPTIQRESRNSGGRPPLFPTQKSKGPGGAGPFNLTSEPEGSTQGVLGLGGGGTSLLFPAIESARSPSTMAPPPRPTATPQPLRQNPPPDLFLPFSACCSAGVFPFSSGFFSSGFVPSAGGGCAAGSVWGGGSGGGCWGGGS